MEPGDTLTVEPDKKPGIQTYVVAPLPVNTVELPEQIVAGPAEAETVGVGLTVTTTVTGAEFEQPVNVPITVYVVVVPGETLTVDPVNPPGVQV